METLNIMTIKELANKNPIKSHEWGHYKRIFDGKIFYGYKQTNSRHFIFINDQPHDSFGFIKVFTSEQNN